MAAAEAAGLNSPFRTTPLACTARAPGCTPKTPFNASTACSGVAFAAWAGQTTDPTMSSVKRAAAAD